MISKITIKGYKSIKEMSIDLKQINILLGSNGVGKSNFISIFSLIRSIHDRNLQHHIKVKGGSDSFLHFGKKNTNKIHFNIHLEKGWEKNRFIVDLIEAQDSILMELVKTEYKYFDEWKPRVFEENVLESKISDSEYGQSFWVKEHLKEIQVYHFHDTGDKSPIKSKCNIDDNCALKHDGSNIAAFLYYLKEKHNKHFLRIEKTIQSIAPFFDEFILEPSKLNEKIIQLKWREKGHPNGFFNAYHLSDGTLRFICLATLLMQPNPPKTIIIDEPELGLHPVAINKLAALIRITQKNPQNPQNPQIIISTQSANLVDNFDPGDIIVVDRKDNASTFRRLESLKLKDWLEEYTLGDIWGKNLIGAQP